MTTGRAGAASADLLPPELLEELGGLEIVARAVVRGFMSGRHRSPFSGSGEDFFRHRAYQQGDDVRHVDWRLFARTDRLYVKQFREESNLEAFILVDASLSMGFGEAGRVTKLRYAALTAAALAHLMLASGDAVGLASFNTSVHFHVPSRNRPGHLRDLLLALERLRPEGKVSAALGLDRMAEMLRRQGRVVLISDLLEDDGGEAMLGALGRLRARGDEVIVLRPLTPLESGEVPAEPGLFFDPEDPGAAVPAAPGADPGYRERVSAYYHGLSKEMAEIGVEYVPLSTRAPLGAALRSWIGARRG
jgi:uncharacterized protein (DUF58 family)